MAHGLLRRILAHAGQEGWIAPGSVIMDPFGGIGSTGILGAYEGYQVVCVELEQKFVDLAEQNFKLHDNAWRKLGCLRPVMLQGDSRQLSEIIGQLAPQGAECIVSSPPYAETETCGNRRELEKWDRGDKRQHGAYTDNPANLGNLKPGDVACVISSPPYAESGGTPSLGSVNKDNWGQEGKDICARRGLTAQYGQTPGNIANLPPGEIAAIISSPPYEGNSVVGGGQNEWAKAEYKRTGVWPKCDLTKNTSGQHYGKSDGQLGESQCDTFWQAAKVIVEQCFQILRPGGHAIWVVKSFVRNKAIVDFPGDWRRLCESVGFETLHEHHAMLYKEPAGLVFEWAKKKRKERVSFFRRNAHNKGAWRNYWDRLPEEAHQRWITKATSQFPKAKPGRILQKAQEFAFADSGEVHWDWNDDIRIDYEVVFCMRKAVE